MSKPLTQSDLDQIEKFADKLFAKIGIDINFTRHFLDRVNDARNRKQITTGELTRLFKQEYKRWGKPIAKLGPNAQAIMKDMQTDVNIPFVLKWDKKNDELDLVAKTIMRKPNFKSNANEPVFPVESVNEDHAELIHPDNIKPNQMYKIEYQDFPMYEIINLKDDYVIYTKHTSNNESQPKKMKVDDFVSIKNLMLFGNIEEDSGFAQSDYGSGVGFDYTPTKKSIRRKRLYPGAEGQTTRVIKRLHAIEDLLKNNELFNDVNIKQLNHIKDALARVMLSVHSLGKNISDKQLTATEEAVSVIESAAYDMADKMLAEKLAKKNGKWALVSKSDPDKVLQYYDGPKGKKPSAKWVNKVEKRVHSFGEENKTVNEISFNTTLPKDAISNTSHYDDFIDTATPAVINRKPVVINGYKIFHLKDDDGYKLLVKDPGQKRFLGGLHLMKPLSNSGGAMQSEVELHPSLHGKGIAIQLYKLALLGYNFTIMSDSIQSKGSKVIWQNLARDPAIEVYTWDPYADGEDGTWSSYDPDEDDDDNVWIEPVARTRELRTEINRLHDYADEIAYKIEDGKINKDKGQKLIDDAHEKADELAVSIRKHTNITGTGAVRLVATRK